MNEKTSNKLETLHLPTLRKKWQIVFLQVISTFSLILLLRKMSEIFGPCSEEFVMNNSPETWCPSYDHTKGLIWLSKSNDLLIPDIFLGINETGTSSLIAPLILCAFITFVWVYLNTLRQKTQDLIRNIIISGFLIWAIIPFIFTWILTSISNGLHLPFGNEDENLNHLHVILEPFSLIIELLFLGLVFAPILAGFIGIWGLSKRPITWAIGYFLVIIGIHALLTFEPIFSEIDLGLQPLSTQIGEGSEFFGLLSPFAYSLLEISVLMLIFLESGTSVVHHLEYAVSLPEDAKINQEYIRQFNNIVNSQLIQLVATIAIVSLITAMSLSFDDLLISIVEMLEGTQWSGQVQESLELQMTYGKVISAGLFIFFIAGLRYFVPWQNIIGYIGTNITRFRN